MVCLDRFFTVIFRVSRVGSKTHAYYLKGNRWKNWLTHTSNCFRNAEIRIGSDRENDDLRRRTPGFTATVLLTLAREIGATRQCLRAELNDAAQATGPTQRR